MSNKLSLLVNFVGVDKMSGALKNIIGLGRKGSRSLNELRGEGRKLERQLRDVRSELKGASGNVTALVDRERELERAIERTNRDIAERKRLYRIEAQRRAMFEKGERLQQRGQDNMVQGAGVLAALGVIAAAGMEYDQQLAQIAQTSDFTAEQTERFGSAIMAAASAAKRMPSDVMAGAQFLAAKGFSLPQLEGAMPAIAKFATAWNTDVVDASRAAFAAVNSLKVPIDQTARALEIMAVAGKEGGFEVADMAKHFPVLTAQLSVFGAEGVASVAGLSAALQVLEARTGDGAVAANDLQNLMRFTTTAQGQKNFKKLGIDIVSELKRAEAEGGDAIERLATIINEATGGDAAKIATLITDAQAGRAALNLAQNIEQYKEVRDAAFAAQGMTAQEFERMSETAARNWEALKGSASGTAMVLGRHLLPRVTETMNNIAKVTNAVGEWAQENPKLAQTILTIVAAGATLKIGLGAAQFALGSFLKPLSSFLAFSKKIGLASKVFLGLRTAALFMAKGVLKAGAMMLANPIVLVITAIVAALAGAAYLVYTHWDTIKAAFVTGWNGVKSFLSKIPDWLRNIGKLMMDGLLLAINPLALGKKLIDMAKNGITAFKNYLGIKSPSRVFMALGENTAEGMALGMQRGERRVIGGAGRMATGIAAAGSMALAPATAAASPAAAPAAAPITINIYQQPGQDARELAEQIRRELEDMAGQQARRSYEDGI